MTQTNFPTIAVGEMIKEADVAQMLCQSVRTLQKWRVTGEGPSYFKIGRSVRYSRDEVLAWRNARRFLHTSQHHETQVVTRRARGPSGRRRARRVMTTRSMGGPCSTPL